MEPQQEQYWQQGAVTKERPLGSLGQSPCPGILVEDECRVAQPGLEREEQERGGSFRPESPISRGGGFMGWG